MNNMQLAEALERTQRDNGDQVGALFGTRMEHAVLLPDTARKDGTFGKWTHTDQRGRRYRKGAAEGPTGEALLEFEVDKGLVHREGKYTLFIEPGEVLHLTPVKPSTQVAAMTVEVTSNTTPFKNKCGVLSYKAVDAVL
jgi:hypothetical protein